MGRYLRALHIMYQRSSTVIIFQISLNLEVPSACFKVFCLFDTRPASIIVILFGLYCAILYIFHVLTDPCEYLPDQLALVLFNFRNI